MKNIKLLLTLIMVAILPFSFSACSKQDNEEDTKTFVGIAIYQKLDGNLNWSKFSANPNAINNIISTQNGKLVLDENPELLFYIYSQNEITSKTTNEDYISNTTKDEIIIQDDSIYFRLERIVEDTEILIYYIYRLDDDSYYLEFNESKTNIINDTESFELSFTHNLFSKIKLILETNLSIKKEY